MDLTPYAPRSSYVKARTTYHNDDSYHIKKIVHGTEGHMAVFGPVRHQKNISWTEASEVHIIFFW
jgi:hypothetical protein